MPYNNNYVFFFFLNNYVFMCSRCLWILFPEIILYIWALSFLIHNIKKRKIMKKQVNQKNPHCLSCISLCMWSKTVYIETYLERLEERESENVCSRENTGSRVDAGKPRNTETSQQDPCSRKSMAWRAKFLDLNQCKIAVSLNPLRP